MTERREPGRPTKYDTAYCEQVVQCCAEGGTLTDFAAEIDVARSTINVWADQHTEFSEALSRAKAKMAAWWGKRAREVAQSGGTGAQGSIIQFALKNLAPDEWSDTVKQEISGPDGGPLRVGRAADGDIESRLAALPAEQRQAIESGLRQLLAPPEPVTVDAVPVERPTIESGGGS